MTADNHLGRHYDRMFSQRLEERRTWLRRGFARAVEHALEQRVHLFLQVGDLFDSPEPRNVERQFVAEALARLRRANVRCLGIGGNHDTPRVRNGQAPATPQGTYSRLGGLRLLGEHPEGPEGLGVTPGHAGRQPGRPSVGANGQSPSPLDPPPFSIDAEVFEIEGVRVAVGGLAPDPTAPAGSDPLEAVAWRPESDLALLLLHGSLEGHVYPGAPEPIVRRQTVERLEGVEYLLVGHVHRFAAFRWGTKTVVVPGATERMTFAEAEVRPGFVYMEVEPGRLVGLQQVAVECQPRRQLIVPTSELGEGDPAEAIKARLEAVCEREAMVRLSLEGPLSRQRYHDLRLREVAEYGAARCFFLDLDTTGLYVEEEQPGAGARGGRLSQREELIRFARESWQAAENERERGLLEEAARAILDEYA